MSGRRVFQVSKRFSHGWLKKNIRVEEYAGLRENKYQTWEFNPKTTGQLLGYCFIPLSLIYVGITADTNRNNLQLTGKPANTGVFPPNL